MGQGIDIISVWENFQECANDANIAKFLEDVADPDWLVHVNHFNLQGEIEFVERNGLDSIILAHDFRYPLDRLDQSELVDAYKKFEDHIYYKRQAERTVHLGARKIVRNQLGLAPLSEAEINVFHTEEMKRPLLRNPSRSPITRYRGEDCTPDELQPALNFMRENYASVFEYIRCAECKGIDQGYNDGRRVGFAGSADGIVTSVADHFLPENKRRGDYALRKLIAQSSL